MDESFEKELNQFSKRLEEQTVSLDKESVSTGAGLVSQFACSPYTVDGKHERRKLVPNVTQTWVGKVRQRLNFGGNFRTHRPSYGGGNLTVV